MNTLSAFVIGVAEFFFGTLFAVVLTYPAIAGYYSVACSNDGLGWSVAVLLLAPLAFPPLAVAWLATGAAVAALGRPFHTGNGFWRRSKWLALGSVGVGVIVWLVSLVTGASARCSFGFYCFTLVVTFVTANKLNQMAAALAPNLSIERTSSSWLRQRPAAAHVGR